MPARTAGPLLESCFMTSRPTVPVAPVTKTVFAINSRYIGLLSSARMVLGDKVEIKKKTLNRVRV